MTLLVHGVHLLPCDLSVAVRVHGGELLGRHLRPYGLQLGEADAAVAILVEALEPRTVMGLAQLVAREQAVTVRIGLGELLGREIRPCGLDLGEIHRAVAVGVEPRLLRVCLGGEGDSDQDRGGDRRGERAEPEMAGHRGSLQGLATAVPTVATRLGSAR